MPDMLVKLYTLPDVTPMVAAQRTAGIAVRRCIAPEKHVVIDWVRATWGLAWGSECEVACGQQPPSCFVAVAGGSPIGFACYDTTARGFFGPIGVSDDYRGRGVGAALLLVALQAMAAHGYGYAIISGVGPADWYTKIVGATLIPDSSPGVYGGMLRLEPREED